MSAFRHGSDWVTLFLAGDVMLGRGLDQILRHPNDPRIFESYVRDSRQYVTLAEDVSGPIPRGVAPAYPWGDAIGELDRHAPLARIVNLETSVTTSNEYEAGKAIHYRMHPANVDCLSAAGIDCCVLGNNHILDWGRAGLLETLDALHAANVKTTGAGSDLSEAEQGCVIEGEGRRRVLVYGVASESSGAPVEWAATRESPGVRWLEDLSIEAAERLAVSIAKNKRPDVIVIASIHWGTNWGYAVPGQQTAFAHALIDGGVDLVHGHSSHHPRPIEVYGGKLVLYGAGDLLNDYEGIGGYEAYRSNLVLLYFPTLEWATGNLVRLRMVPMRIEKMRLERASLKEAGWLARRLDAESRAFGTRIAVGEGGVLEVMAPLVPKLGRE